MVAGVLAAVLGRERVRAEDNFFELGGHSLLATHVISRLRALGFELPVRQLFETPTVAALAAAIGQRHGEGSEPPITRLPRTGTFPLSFSQERLWFLDRLQPGNASYNMPVAVRLRGALDPGLLARSLNEVVGRHEILRTTFGAVDGQPFQRIAERLELPLPLLDLRGLARPGAELDRQIAAEKATPFDLERGPLMRARLFRLAEEDWVLLANLHHIVSDGWSLRRLFSELAWLYGAFLAGEPSPLPELEVQYGDHACWQRRWFQGEVLERQLDYWRRQLDGTLPVLDLPTDRPRPPIQTFQGGSLSTLLPGEVCAGLHALGRRRGATLFMTMFAAFNLLLHRYSGQEDILVGIPIAGRNRAQIEDLIGFFINSLVLRTDLSGQPSFSELLERARQVALDAYAHQDLSFVRLLQELRLERDLSRTPLFQVYFNFQGFMGPLPSMPGLEVESLSSEEELSKFDLTLYVLEEGDGQVRLDLVYNATLFSAVRCREMLDQYVAVLAQVAARPDAAIDQVSLLTPRALALLPDDTLELDAGWMGPVHLNLIAWAERDPGRVAVTDPTCTWTYGELEARSNQLAHYLLADGIQKEEAVAIYAHRSATLIWAVLGVLKAGAAFVVVDPAYPPARIIEILRLVRPRFWLGMESAGSAPEPLAAFMAELPGSLQLPSWNADDGALAGLPAEDPGIPIGPDDLAYISFTSGSTGVPKGILGRHGPLSHFLPWQCRELGLAASDRFSLLSGLAHDPLQRDIFTPLYLGARICIPDPTEILVPGKLSAWMRQEAVSVAHLTPAMGQILTESGPQAAESLPSLRRVLLVGDILTRRDVARLQRLAPGVACVNLYGSTETQRAVGYHVVATAEDGGEQQDKEVLPLGCGMKDVQLLVRNRAGQTAGIGELGEVVVRSPHLARGYLGDEEATARKFLANPATGQPWDRLYLTGDLGRYLPNGEVAFAGRADTQVKIRGFRIEMGEIESQLGRVDGVREAVVLATEGGGANGRLVAFVVRETGSEAAAADLRGYLKTVMPAYMVPTSFLFLPKIPLTPNGKVDRRELLRLAGAQREGETASYQAPRTQAELRIAGILREVLGVELIGAEDNFFDLGGNSLLLLQVQSRVQAAFNRELPVLELFSNPTVSALAKHLALPEPSSAPVADDAAEQLEAGKRRRLRRFQQNQKAAERRPGGFNE
jgi:amino acid adenylation domain-containing protein